MSKVRYDEHSGPGRDENGSVTMIGVDASNGQSRRSVEVRILSNVGLYLPVELCRIRLSGGFEHE